MAGRYFGSTVAGQWLNRIVAHGLGTRTRRGPHPHRKGALRVDRPRRGRILHPRRGPGRGPLREAAMAARCCPRRRPAGRDLEARRHAAGLRFRSDHAAEHDAWVDAVNRLVAGDVPTPNGTNKEGTAQ
ncbi:PH-like domain-containing protein [Yinghuangia aomiensis]